MLGRPMRVRNTVRHRYRIRRRIGRDDRPCAPEPIYSGGGAPMVASPALW